MTMVLKKLLSYGLLISWICTVHSSCISDDDAPSTDFAPIVCTSKTKFILVDDIVNVTAKPKVPKSDATFFECPSGLVCAAVPGICVDENDFGADCPPPQCGNCAGSRYACISPIEFVICSNGARTTFSQKCPTDNKYCQVSDKTATAKPCQTDFTAKDCEAAISTVQVLRANFGITEDTTEAVADCSEGRIGKFANQSDNSCQSYFYCTDSGKRTDFTCPGAYLFDKTRKKCVSPYQYTCSM